MLQCPVKPLRRVEPGPKSTCQPRVRHHNCPPAQGPSADPFGTFFDVILRDMLGTIPGGEEFLASVLGMAGRGSAAGFLSIQSGR